VINMTHPHLLKAPGSHIV